MTTFTLSCTATDRKHTRFTVFDGSSANCGYLTIETKDVPEFVSCVWSGMVRWNGLWPYGCEER